MAAAIITAARLRELLNYDPETGVFTWAVDRGPARKGGAAGAAQKIGYVVIRLAGQLYYAHRLAFLHMTGEWPKMTVDHIDGCKSNNRWSNLRDVDHVTNCENQRFAQGVADMMGAVWNKRTKNWRSVITTGDKQVHLGTFSTPEAAHAAYIEAKRRLHAGCTI